MPPHSSGRPALPLVILEFIGGAWDGMNLSNHSPDPTEAGLAVYAWQATQRGRVGRCVTLPSQYAVRHGGCEYKVVAHHTAHGEALVRLEVCAGDCRQRSPLDGKVIVLRFSGGCLDGRSLRSDSSDLAEALLTTAYFGLTRQGSPSESLQILPAVWRQLQRKFSHAGTVAQYRVVERRDDGQTITVELEYRSGSG